MTKLTRFMIAIGVLTSAATFDRAFSNPMPADGFNHYIIEAVKYLKANYAALGYDISQAYTHDIPYGKDSNGKDTKVNGSPKHYTMCVAAVAEVIITAIKIYEEEKLKTKDSVAARKPLEYLPASSWNRMRPDDLRSHI